MSRFQCVYKHVTEAMNRTLNKAPAKATLFVIALFIGAFFSVRWIDGNAILQIKSSNKQMNPFLCGPENQTITCPAHNLTSMAKIYDKVTSPFCPEYFRWIHEDLRPWNVTGISKEMVERARPTANFRLVILDGRIYVETFSKAFETRDVFTLWGVIQLLRRYPGRVPDLDLMFDCNDGPVVRSRDYEGKDARAPPPLFAYCRDSETLDIVFPDWSFWGWPEVDIKPWEQLFKDLKHGNERLKWVDREPYAYWKGNFWVAATRQDLLKCNLSKTHDWNARLYGQAQEVGNAASSFMQEELKMDYVYDYMFHLLNEYSKLLTYKPMKPEKAIEFCLESMGCPAKGLVKEFMVESMVNAPAESSPCTLPPALNRTSLEGLLRKKENLTKQVEIWESLNKI